MFFFVNWDVLAGFLNRLAKLWLGLSCVPIPISGSSSISGDGILYILFYKPKTKEQKQRKKKKHVKLNLHVKRWLLYYLHIPAYNLELPQGPQLVIIFLARPMDEYFSNRHSLVSRIATGFVTSRNKGSDHSCNIILAKAQPPKNCSFARHLLLVWKMVIPCSFAPHWSRITTQSRSVMLLTSPRCS